MGQERLSTYTPGGTTIHDRTTCPPRCDFARQWPPRAGARFGHLNIARTEQYGTLPDHRARALFNHDDSIVEYYGPHKKNSHDKCTSLRGTNVTV